VKDWDELTKRVQKIRRELNDEALAEEYIVGREVYVGVIGPPTRPDVLPIVELDFGDAWKKDEPKISDREVKFGPETKDGPRLKIARDLSPELKSRIERAALLAYRALKICDYARIDFRVSDKGEPYVLEVNPNPYLEAQSELAMAAAERGITYSQLINRIVESACVRYQIKARQSGEHPAVEAPRSTL
jgi:D-alanine-D-alanine ligase